MDSSSRRARTADYNDARSNVDSFYGGRGQSTYEPVHEDEPFTAPPQHNRRDSASTFFGRGGEGYVDDEPRKSDGRNSYYGQPRQEPVKGMPHDDEEAAIGSGGGGAAWDVYADFNNAGPRYSGATNLGSLGNNGRDGYRSLHTPEGSKIGIDDADPVELVTVPAFGPEWGKAELRAMTKRGRAEEKSHARSQKWREWKNDNRGLFGSKWLTRKTLVWIIFGLIIVVAVLLAITLPRSPSFGFNPTAPVTAGKGDPVFTRGPEANFTFNANLDLEMSTSGNVIPLHLNNIHAQLFSIDTNKQIAEGNSGSFNRGPGTSEQLDIPIVFQYSAADDKDATWNLVYNACKSTSLYPSGSRPGLNVLVVLEMSIRGMIKKAGASTSITNLACPIELPTSSV